jgi:hypothetical protein
MSVGIEFLTDPRRFEDFPPWETSSLNYQFFQLAVSKLWALYISAQLATSLAPYISSSPIYLDRSETPLVEFGWFMEPQPSKSSGLSRPLRPTQPGTMGMHIQLLFVTLFKADSHMRGISLTHCGGIHPPSPPRLPFNFLGASVVDLMISMDNGAVLTIST